MLSRRGPWASYDVCRPNGLLWVLWAGLPGQDTGNALTDVLYGIWNPPGRLLYKIAKQVSDYPARVVMEGSGIVQINYTEGCVSFDSLSPCN